MRHPQLLVACAAVLIAAALGFWAGVRLPPVAPGQRLATGFDPAPHEMWSDPETGLRFAVVSTEEHPFLRDHERELIVVPKEGVLARVALYPDAGAGAHSNLYRNDLGQYVLIDMNGIWLTFHPVTGEVLSCQWRWEEKTPRDYLGTFQAGSDVVYRLVPAAERSEPPIYGEKAPSHPLLEEPR